MGSSIEAKRCPNSGESTCSGASSWEEALRAASGNASWATPEPAATLRHSLLQSAKQTATLMADPSPRFGFVAFAETWNGRLAMLGFVIGLATELLTGQSILSQIGLG